jgi:hypothetical protein
VHTKFCVWPAFRFGLTGLSWRLTSRGVAVTVGSGVTVRVGVGFVDVGVGVGASTTVITALSFVAVVFTPVVGSVA